MTERKTGEGGADPRNPREQKLAQALRDNLRRRKAAARPAHGKSAEPDAE
jgi:hypothetical protein